MKRINKPATVGLALAAFVVTFSLMEGPAHAEPFLGKWRAEAEVRDGVRKKIPRAVVMTIEFASGGKFRQTVKMGKRSSPPEEGEWKLKEGKLVVKSGPSKGRRTTKLFEYRRSGKKLQLTMKLGKETVVLHLRRAR
jgi:hypothetical protein